MLSTLLLLNSDLSMILYAVLLSDTPTLRLVPIMGCAANLAEVPNSIPYPAYLSVIIFNTVVLILTLVRAIRECKLSRSSLSYQLRLTSCHSSSQVVPHPFTRGACERRHNLLLGCAWSVIFALNHSCPARQLRFHSIAALSISGLVAFVALPVERSALINAFASLIPACDGIIGSRIVLNMRAAAKEADPAADTDSESRLGISELFAAPEQLHASSTVTSRC